MLIRMTLVYSITVVVSSILALFIYQESLMSDTVRSQIARPLSASSVVGIGWYLMVRWGIGQAYWRGLTSIAQLKHTFVFGWTLGMMVAYFAVAVTLNTCHFALSELLRLMFASGLAATVVWISVTCIILLVGKESKDTRND